MKSAGVAVFLILQAQTFSRVGRIDPPFEKPAVIHVRSAVDLQSALDRATPGQVIELPAGMTFTGNFVLPQRAGTRFITIQTASSPGLPDTDGRVDPTYSGKLAKIQSPNNQPAIRTAPGSHHWRLSLLEFGPNARALGDIVVLGDGSAEQSDSATPHDFIVDRCYIHGDPELGQKRGIALNSASTTISGSYISEIKSTSQDAQAIAGWNGPGPFLIENNYLEASGENFMLGGALPRTNGLVPTDVVFRRNHVSRPAAWKDQRWAVKNLFELKNARGVLVEGNLFENNWVAAQAGYAIVFTPRGEGGRAPWSTVEDVTFRHNIIRNVSAGFNLLGHDNGGKSGTMKRVTIADNLVYGLDKGVWGGNGAFLQIGGGPAAVIVEHNTVVQSGNAITVYGGTKGNPTTINGFVFRNNVMLHNSFGVIGQGVAFGSKTISAYFPDGVFQRNVLAGGAQSRYPPDNFFPDFDKFMRQFANYQERDYRLRPDSEFRRAASDGTDLGVDFVALGRAVGNRAREWIEMPSRSASEGARCQLA
jgi:hypothetical protein